MPSNISFEPHCPRYGLFMGSGQLDTICAYFGQIFAIWGLFLRHIVALEGNIGLGALGV